MLSIAKTALILLSAASTLSLGGAATTAAAAAAAAAETAPQDTATPASTAPAPPVPRETGGGGGGGGGNLLGNIYKLARGLGLARCVPRALPLVTTLPRLPAGLLDGGGGGGGLAAQALSQTTLALSDVCRFSVTGPAGDAYTSFLPAWYSWHSAHRAAISRVLEKCPAAAALASTVEAYESCPQVASAAATDTATATLSSSGGGGDAAAGTGVSATPDVGTGTTSDDAATEALETTASASDVAALRDTCLAVSPAVAVGLLGFVAAPHCDIENGFI